MNSTATRYNSLRTSSAQTNHRQSPFLLPAIHQPRALVLSASGAGSLPEGIRHKLEKIAAVRYQANLEPLDPQAFISLAQPYEYLAITRRAIHRFDRHIMQSLPRLKGVSVYSTGVEWIDTTCMRERNIRLASLPDYCTNAVAETALGLMFMTAHKLHLRYLKSVGKTPDTVSLRGFELKNCSVGIIGYGKIGRLLAEKVRPLCTRVLANDVDDNPLDPPVPGVQMASKAQILSTCDFVVVCASQQFDQRQIIAPELYTRLRSETVLINVGRTSLLDHRFLIKLTKQQRIRAYIYDDLMRADDLPDEFEFGKIIPTGHTAWYTDEAIIDGTNNWLNNLVNLCKRP